MTDVPRICKSCGAPLHGYKCEYCDDELSEALDMAIKALERQSEDTISRQAAIDALQCRK